jgi:hypothetical protein
MTTVGASVNVESADVAELLPRGTQVIDTRVRGVWGLGQLRTAVSVTPSVLGDRNTDAEIRTVSSTTSAFVLP